MRGGAALMRRSGTIALVVALLIGGGFAWCKLTYPKYTYRYRMTVEVMVDGVVRSGSSVIEIRIQTQPNLLSNSTIVPHVRGEATYVDLGGGRNVIALLAMSTIHIKSFRGCFVSPMKIVICLAWPACAGAVRYPNDTFRPSSRSPISMIP